MQALTCGLSLLLLAGPLSASPICTEGDMLPNPSDCGSYYACSQGVLDRRPCPAGLHFNAALLVCDYPKAAGCDSSAGPEPNDCPPNMASAYLAHPNCQRYYHCSLGVAYERTCQPSLHWHQAWQSCNWPQQAGCVEGAAREQPGAVLLEPVPVTVATVEPVTEEQTTEAVIVTEAPLPAEEQCLRQCERDLENLARYFAHPDCNMYYACDGAKPVEQECPGETKFSAFYNACVFDYVTECVDGAARPQC